MNLSEVIKKLFSKPLPATRGGSFYNAFAYQTKISPETIAVYIASLTKPGDTILDPFGGSGSTAAAALMCEHPTAAMLKLAQTFGISPVWGRRNAVIYDIGVFGSFASSTILNRITASEFERTVNDFLLRGEEKLRNIYEALDVNGKQGKIRYIIWSEVFTCKECKKQISYFEGGTQRNPVRFFDELQCPHCGHKQVIDSESFVREEYFDPILQRTMMRKKRIPAWIYGETDGVNWDRKATSDDLRIAEESKVLLSKEILPKEICWGELYRAGYHFGITHLHHFYTVRNFIVMQTLWDIAEKYEKRLSDALKLLLLSYNASHSTLMTRVVAKKNSKDFVLTGAQSGVLYVSKLPVEKNILSGLKRKAKSIKEAYSELEKCTGKVTVRNQSSEKMKDENNSIDFVFTDPPFGDFIPYAEVNQINELWLDKVTDRSREAVINPSQGVSVLQYGKMLSTIFKEVSRVTKPSAKATVVFHAAKAEIWNALSAALDGAGLTVLQTNVLDKTQPSFKQIVSDISVRGDPLFLLQKKQGRKRNRTLTPEVIIDKIISECKSEKIDRKRIYSLYINWCFRSGIEIVWNAETAYKYIESQVQEVEN